MRRNLSPGFALLLGCIAMVPLSANRLKKVLILDVVNIDKNTNYDYLVGSITDALTEKLKTNFAFKETPKADWQSAAQKNDLFFEDESYTKTFAMTLGIRMRQDIAISGGFKVVVIKGQQQMRATLFIIDVPNKKIIGTVEKNMPLTGDMFSKVDELANQLAKSAESVLPGKDFYEKNKDDFDVSTSSLRLVSEAYFMTLLGPKQLDETSLYITQSRIPLSYGGGLRFQSSVWRKLDWYVQGVCFYANTALTSQQSGTSVPQTMLGGNATGGLGYTLDLNKRFHMTPWLGGGYFVGQTTISYANFSRLPTQKDGTKTASSVLLFYGPTANAGIDFSFDLSRSLFVSLGVTSIWFFNGQGASANLGASLSSGWRF
ncbi:MAG: hypothetical protein U1F27_08485 [Turneriella sp.]